MALLLDDLVTPDDHPIYDGTHDTDTDAERWAASSRFATVMWWAMIILLTAVAARILVQAATGR